MNILIVDDHPVNRKLLRIQLEAEGIGVAEAADGVDALDVLANKPVDAVVSDILMPRMDGYRLCQEVRTNAALREVAFILYSSTYTTPADIQLCAAVGADQFIPKPAPIGEILNTLALFAKGGVPPAPEIHVGEIILKQYSAVLLAKLSKVVRAARMKPPTTPRSASAAEKQLREGDS